MDYARRLTEDDFFVEGSVYVACFGYRDSLIIFHKGKVYYNNSCGGGDWERVLSPKGSLPYMRLTSHATFTVGEVYEVYDDYLICDEGELRYYPDFGGMDWHVMRKESNDEG